MNNEQLAAQAQQGIQPTLYALWEQVEQLMYSKFRGLYYHYVPSQCAAHGVTLNDLYQKGWFAFLAAVRAYTPGGWKFNTYRTVSGLLWARTGPARWIWPTV